MSLFDELNKKIDEKKSRMIEIRRHLHENPELSFEEKETSKYIKEFYDDVDIDEIETEIGGMYGHLVTIKGAGDGPTIAVRADFDALPIQEGLDLDFKSKNDGVMHACGHDGHTAYLLILAESLAELKDQINGTVKIIHQPAEETPPGGAKTMIESGVLEGVDQVFGIHLVSVAETGSVYTHSGNTQAARGYFKLKVQGSGGHGSMPQISNDAIVAASSFVMNVQTVVSRRLNPFDMGVVTIGSFDGAGSFNIIKDSVVLEGDVRSMTDEAADKIEEEVTRLAKGLEASFGVEVELEYNKDYPVLYNDPENTERVTKILKEIDVPEIKEIGDTGEQSTSEDFAYFTQEKPGVFFYVGAAPDDKEPYSHHHPKFEINEDALTISAKAMAAVVADYVG